MPEQPFSPEQPTTPNRSERELETLRERSVDRMRELEQKQESASKEQVISEQIDQYRQESKTEEQSAAMTEQQIETISLNLSPESHDHQMQELLRLVQEKGVKNALRVLEKMNNPHLEDDFHRWLVAYIKAGYYQGVKSRSKLGRQLNMGLFEVILPRVKLDEESAPLKELISSMEQFYTGMRSIVDTAAGPQNFTLEIALEEVGAQFSFYVAVPRDKQVLFEKQLIGIFPHASIIEQKDDYNIFNADGQVAAAYGFLEDRSALPLRTYDSFDFDPLNSILNSFSKLDTKGEGAAIQLILSPVGGDKLHQRFAEALRQVEKGESLDEALDVGHTIGGQLVKNLKHSIFSAGQKKDQDKLEAQKQVVDQSVVENIKHKLSGPLFFANLRLIASSRSQAEAEAILADMESAFAQLENSAGGNRLKFSRVTGRALKSLLRDFSYRQFRFERSLPLNTKELSTFMHFQTAGLKELAGLKKTYVQTAAPPSALPADGVVLGINEHRGEEREVRLADEDRLRHFYCIGQTGTGKSTLLKNMAIQDIERGQGVGVIDPHGSDLDDILSAVPSERYDDVIYFDPSHTERPMALNMLEYDPQVPEQKTFVVNELFSIFQKLYSNVPESMGPMFEQYFRNAAALVVEDPQSGNTLLDISRVLSNKEYRELKLSRCQNPVVIQFWQEVAQKASGDAGLQNIVPYITSKFDVFLANDIMRPIVSQERSSFDFRSVMDERKILLVNLSKGRLGELNSNLLGLIIVGKILMAALARGSAGSGLSPFNLYIDEFQNVTTDTISTILSEARKYGLSLTVAHQFISQLEDSIRNAVFGNVGSMAAFRVGADDGEFLEQQFKPNFSASDLINVKNRNAYVRLLIDGQPSEPFNLVTRPPAPAKLENPQILKELSWAKYGRDRLAVEQEIMRKYQDLKK